MKTASFFPRMRGLKRWTMRVSVGLAILVITTLGVFLNPGLLYAHSTTVGGFTVYHQSELTVDMEEIIEEATELVQQSEFYDPDFELRLCLNDGSAYMDLVRFVRGDAFGYGFFHQVLVYGTHDPGSNTTDLRGYRWNLAQLIAHEAAHCLEYNHFGFWKTNPVGSHAHWKWEGYPEYVSRRGPNQLDLACNYARWVAYDALEAPDWGVVLEDGTIAPPDYYSAWLLVQFCLDVKGMTAEEMFADERSREDWWSEMEAWLGV